MGDADVRLVEPAVDLQAAFLAMVDDYRTAGEERYQRVRDLAARDFAEYVRSLEARAQESGLPPGRVPQTTYWLLRGDTLLAVGRLRHRLNAALEREAGHIGYDVRPSERGKGFGTLLLALTLERARERGLERVLVTCDTDNVASARVIEKNGGVLEDEVVSEETGKPLSRYWIDLIETSRGTAVLLPPR